MLHLLSEGHIDGYAPASFRGDGPRYRGSITSEAFKQQIRFVTTHLVLAQKHSNAHVAGMVIRYPNVGSARMSPVR